MRLSKEEFCGYINFIENQSRKETALCDALEAMTDNCYCDFFCYSSYENNLIRLLSKCMDISDDNDIISYYIADCDFGRKGKDVITEVDGSVISLTSPEELYDYIINYLI